MEESKESVVGRDFSKERARCFVIQPFGKRKDPKTGKITNNEQVFEALTLLENMRPLFPIRVERADTKTIKEEDLHDNVIEKLRDSDFCIADLTGQNPNVLYEVGYARGLGLAVVLLAQDLAEIPTDLKKYIIVTYGTENLDDLPNAIATHLDVVKNEILTKAHTRWANVVYFATRNDADIRKRILAAREHIDILQTNLVTINTDYLQQIIASMRRRPGLRLRFLTLNPQSIFVNYRGVQVGFEENIALYREELDNNLRAVHFALREFGDRVEIRIYDDFPNQIVFYFDHDILVCIVTAAGRSRENCAFLVNARLPGATQSFRDHFNLLWDRKSVSYPLPQ